MTPEIRTASERAVERLLTQCFNYLDSGALDDVAELFGESGIWHRQGNILHGRAAVRASLAERRPGLLTRHVITNVLAEAESADRSSAAFYLIAYRDLDGQTKTLPVPMQQAFSLGDYRIKAARLPEGWRIAELNSTAIFRD